ncbi:MAG: hypothetical protein KF795_30085 [Labilithrix sp.]|nr:hypothetical protein [Labilithrix sp.]
MIEIRLRAAASNPSSRPWRWGVSLAALALCIVAPVATSRAQDAGPTTARGLESLKALEVVTIDGGRSVTIDGGESISIRSGASSITMKKDGTIVIKGTEIVIDGDNKTTSAPGTRAQQNLRASQMSEIF